MVNSKNRIIDAEAIDIPDIDNVESQITVDKFLLPLNEARQENTEKFEKEYLMRILRKTDVRVIQAAKQAGITRQAFQRLMKKHGFRSRQFRSSRFD